MSTDRNHIEYVQLTKLYDECLIYLKENHEDLQTIVEGEEPGYETIKEISRNDMETIKANFDNKTANNYVIEENKVTDNMKDKENSDDTTHSNDFLSHYDTIKKLDLQNVSNEKSYPTSGHKSRIINMDNETENINEKEVLYETLNPAIELNDDSGSKTPGDEENKLPLVKYDESENYVYETYNPDVKFCNDNIKEDNIEIVINNNRREDKNTESEHTFENNEKEETKEFRAITFKEYKKSIYENPIVYKLENEVKSTESISSLKSERLRKLSQQLPKIIITSSSTSLNLTKNDRIKTETKPVLPRVDKLPGYNRAKTPQLPRTRRAYGEFPKRLVSKTGLENVALISNVPFEKIRLLNDTFHTLINLRWRWIVIGTVVVHFLIWLVFALFWYITALAHYDFEPDPPKRTCVTGGKDFVTIFLASVEAQTTIGFGDRTIDEECPEAIFLFIMQLILGTGLSGVLTCVVYAKLTRPEKLSRDGVGFSKKAVISLRDGRLCLMIRAWDLNYDHIISSEFAAHFINTRKTKEGEVIRYYAQNLVLQQRQFLLWPVTLVHVIDENSPLYKYGPDVINHSSYEITVSLKGASASMGTFTQSQTSYLPREIIWGHRFPPVVKYDCRKQKYVIDHKKLDVTEAVDTPYCSAEELNRSIKQETDIPRAPSIPSSFSEKLSVFHLGRTSSFRKKTNKS